MHRLPIQAKDHHLHGVNDHRRYLGASDIHHVSVWCDAAGDQGAHRTDLTGLRQQDRPLLLVQRELAKPGNEENLHHCVVCKHLSCPSFPHCDYVRPDWDYAFQNSRSNRRKAGPGEPPQCVEEEAKGDKNASYRCSTLHPFLAASLDFNDAE